ncbi:hypothetical protein Lupro_08045 [Lutibacter profundi]|uniref:DUF4412 domain-containing protein n=1 Tax=Lutibacter profundi TaxID=1622118 RepID=A0A0X8G715_9FLAO|nr:hypothetical protein [Lutibacter profundi]AMC11208.1 hypothetical protein Lupro_08045 [Lutibacter profundi]
MKKLNILLSLIIILTSCSGNSQNKLKRYDVKSGIVKYTSTISGKVLGGEVKGSGTESLYFKNWGAVELKEEQATQTTTMKFFGRSKTEKNSTHVINKLNNGESYVVDFDKKIITVGRDVMMDMMKQSNTDAGDAGKSMLESIGGKKIGNESFLGYNCEVWDIKGAKQWMYKGVPLKIDITVLGIRTLKEATSAKFNVSVADSNFKLPNFPIQKQEGFMNNQVFEGEMDGMNDNMDQISKLSFEEWKKLATKDDSEMQEMSDEELHQTYNMIQKMIKMRKGN